MYEYCGPPDSAVHDRESVNTSSSPDDSILRNHVEEVPVVHASIMCVHVHVCDLQKFHDLHTAIQEILCY